MNRLRASTPSTATSNHWLPPTYEQPHVCRQFDEVMASVAEAITPVWPLQDYVAVSPYAGLCERPFLDARAFLRVFSDCELLMPLEHYAQQFHRGQFGIEDLEAALRELQASGLGQQISAGQIVEQLQAIGAAQESSTAAKPAPNPDRRIRTIAEYVDSTSGTHWREAFRDEVSKHCAAHYDQGQAVWASPWKHLPLYQAWRSAAELDRNPEILGLSGFCRYVSSLPHTPEAAIVHSLVRLGVPQSLWISVLLCQAFSIPGWSAWAKYKDAQQPGVAGKELAGLLAMRLAYDAALSEVSALSVRWDSLFDNGSPSFRPSFVNPGDDSRLRLALLRASEIAFSNGLLRSFSHQPDEPALRKRAQMVFCIDVRSERIRRQLEQASTEIETFGFAGFFGMPVEFVPLGEALGSSQVPVLLKPQFQLHEALHAAEETAQAKAIGRREQIRSWRKLWQDFQTSAVGSFSFVETTGLLYGLKLLGSAVNALPCTPSSRRDGLEKKHHEQLGPTLRGLGRQGFGTAEQADLAEAMLKNIGLTTSFARLVVFCGHGSQTTNNPLAAGLDCGACGGHSGEPNARLAALLLNQPQIRAALCERGINVPSDTHFLAGLHNTTTDQIEYFDLADVPDSHTDDLQQLLDDSNGASKRTRQERLPIVQSRTIKDLLQRASDWSEVRPEWGLAGNAAFIAAPRWSTKGIHLDGRVFLHSYEHQQDPQGRVLETIMTAPMMVAHWINMQYYASTVDHPHFGSGSKTIHNVVGRFGILSGNSGDLMTGLPWQSLHTGELYQHIPMRLQAIIAAARTAIERVIDRQEAVANLLAGGWLHLVAIDDGVAYRYTEQGTWQVMESQQPLPQAAC